MENTTNKLSNIIRVLLLIIAIILTYILYIISNNLENGRYQLGNNSEGYIRVFDTKTGELYFINDYGDYIKYKNKKEIKLQSLPK